MAEAEATLKSKGVDNYRETENRIWVSTYLKNCFGELKNIF